jgi:hypothetical protein
MPHDAISTQMQRARPRLHFGAPLAGGLAQTIG